MDDTRGEYVQLLLEESREELTRADTKISVLLGAAGVAVSIVAGDIVAGHWSPASLAPWAQAVWWIGTCSAALGFVTLTRALAPRLYDIGDKAQLLYFGHVARYQSIQDLFEPLNNASDKAFRLKISQLWAISKIVARKYTLVRISLRLFAGAVVLLAIARMAG